MGILNAYIDSITTRKSQTSNADSSRIRKPSVTLFEWEAPERLFKKRDREFYRKITVIILFFAMMLFIIKDFTVIIVLGVIFAVIYVFTSIPPMVVRHKITTNGLDYASQYLYEWEVLSSFFIENTQGSDILNINTKNSFPGRIMLILSKDVDKEALSVKLNEYLSIVENPERNVYMEFVKKVGSKLNI